jgi:23S rRNA pseudouridine1911/1915/1917 synthase
VNPKKVVVKKSGRLDKVLAATLGQSRNQIEKLIREKQVMVDGETILKPGTKIEPGDTITYSYLAAPKREEIPIEFDVDILYEDDDILVVNKPAGLVVHPAPSVKSPTLVDWLVKRGISLSTISGEERHGIVHRIDKDTTGALAIAKNNFAHRKLSEQLQDKSMGRYYIAIINQPIKKSREVDAPIARNPKNRLKMAIVDGGRASKTQFAQLATSSSGSALICAKLSTGRTHQIRVHLGVLGRYVLGDGLYGFKSKEGKISRIYLHAYMLYLVHPVSGKKLEIVAPLFGDMLEFLSQKYNKETIDEAIQPNTIHDRFDDDVFL